MNLTGSTTNGVITYNGYSNSATVQSGLRYTNNQLFVTSSIRTNALTSSFAKFNGYTQFLPVGNKIIPSNTTASYIYVSGSTNDLYFTQYQGPYTNTTRFRWLESSIYTGILNGGILSSTPGSTTFGITAGEGLIVTQNASTASAPYPTITLVKWPNYTNQPIQYSGSAKITYVGIDNTGQIIQQTVPWGTNNINQYDTSINLGVVLTLSGSKSTGVYNSPQISYGYPQKNDDFTRAFGPLKLSGHVLQASGSTTLSIKKTGGSAYKEGSNYLYDPNHPSSTSENAINTSKIYRYYLSGSTAIINTGLNNVGFSALDNTKYVNLTTGQLVTIGGGGNNSYTIQRVFWIPKSPTNAFIAYYGNGVYTTLVEAKNAIDTEPFTEAPNTATNAIFVAYVIMEASATNFTNVGGNNTTYIQAGGLFRSVGGIGASGGSAVSNTLAGLSDVSISSPTYGDLLMYGNGTQWNNTKTLQGAYIISGSLKTTGNISGSAMYTTNGKGRFYGTASYALSSTGGGSSLRTGSTYPITASWATNIVGSNAFLQGGNSFGTTATLGTNDNQVLVFETNNSERARIDSGGNVGIGTTSPSSKLHVYDNGGSFRTDLDATYHMGILNEYVSTYVTRTKFGRWGTTSNLELYYDIAGTEEARITRNYSAAVLKFNRDVTTDMIIDGNGNVGIGTTAPATKFEMYGGNMALKMTGATTGSFQFKNSSGTKIQEIRYDDSDGSMTLGGIGSYPIKFITSTTEKVRITGTGEVGIGTTSALTTGGTAQVSISTNTNAVALSFGASNTDMSYIRRLSSAVYQWQTFNGANAGEIHLQPYGGNVGIGTSSPSAKLHVTGSSSIPAGIFMGNVGVGTTTPLGGLHINNAQGAFAEILRLQRNGGIFYSVGLDTNFLNIAYNGNTNASNIFVLKTNGFLGLGNLQTANYNLDIASTQAQGIQLRFDTSTNYLARITPYWNSNTDSRIDFAINRSGGVTPDVIMSVGYGTNVGIGTTAPAYKLQVSGSIAPVGDNKFPLGNPSNRFSDLFAVQSTIGGLFETGLRTTDLGLYETGTIVSWKVDKCVPCEIEEDELVMGVVKYGKDEPLILGAEPILVTGVVEVGDYIVTSKKKGHGKAVKRGNLFKKDLFGKVIAQALESGNGESYAIKAMIRKM